MFRQPDLPTKSDRSKPTFSRSVRSTITGWWMLPTHLALVTALAIVLLYGVQGRQFAVSQEEYQDSNAHWQLAQPDVIALVSAVLTLIRALAGAAITLIGWSMAFLTLSTKGVTLAQIDRLISWRQPPIKGYIALWTVFVLSVPSQFTAPVLQGAINWIPDTQYKVDGRRDVTTSGPSDHWAWHNFYTNNRYYEVLQAVGIAALASPENFKPLVKSNSIPSIPSRRLVPSLQGESINSSVSNISLPFLQIHSLKWARTMDDIGTDMNLLDSVISNSSAPALSFSDRIDGEPNPFRVGTDVARLVLVNERKWQAEPQDEAGIYNWPPSEVLHRIDWVIVALTFSADCTGYLPTFGIINDIYFHDAIGSCFIFARLNYTAGGLSCKGCKIVADGVVEALAEYMANQTVLPDAMAETAISMIPEVLFYTKVANSSLAPTWNNLDGYTIGMLATAYQASWNSLTNTFGRDFTPMDSTELSVPVGVLRARIVPWRIWLWLGLNACLTVSGLVLVWLQWYLRAGIVRYPALTALLIDPQGFFETRANETIDVNRLSKNDLSAQLRLDTSAIVPRLVVGDPNNTRRLHHYKQYTRPTMQDDASSELELISGNTLRVSHGPAKGSRPSVVSMESLSSSRDY